mgnify:CR=1 FL=1
MTNSIQQATEIMRQDEAQRLYWSLGMIDALIAEEESRRVGEDLPVQEDVDIFDLPPDLL